MATKTKEAPAVDLSEETSLAPRYHVILLDDDDHSYEYVIEMLQQIFAHSEQRAFLLAQEVDASGRAIVYTCHLELAELKQQQIHAFGPDWRIAACAGSMSAVLESAPA